MSAKYSAGPKRIAQPASTGAKSTSPKIESVPPTKDAIAEIASAIAVTLSLIFVGLQIRDNTVASQAATYQAIARDDLSLLFNVSSDPMLARTFGIYSWDADALLDDQEIHQAQWHFLAMLRFLENVWFQYEQGMLSEEAWTSRDVMLRNVVTSPGFERLLASGRADNISGPFWEHISEIRAAAGLSSNR